MTKAASNTGAALRRIKYFWIVEDSGQWAEQAATLGLDAGHVAASGRDDATTEIQRLKDLGLPTQDKGFDPRLPVFQQVALSVGAVTAPCPWCGRTLASYESYPVLINLFDQPVFYRFECCGEFYLVASMSPQVKIALWLPGPRVLASFAEYRSLPHQCDYYARTNFEEWLKLFHRLLERHEDLIPSYRSGLAARRTALACGFVFNFGHHISDELSALPFAAGLTAGREPLTVIGPFDFFDLGQVFAEYAGPAPLRVTARGNNTPPELFRLTLRENLFITRLSHTAPLQESVAQRLMDAASQRCSPGFFQRVEQSARCRPLAWVTLRSHNRSWRGQAEGLPQVLNALRQDYPGLGVVFDGLEPERPVLKEVKARLAPSIPIFDGLGTSLFEALAWVRVIDFFIAPLGNGTGFTSIANKPGVVHTHEEWGKPEPFCINRRENCVLALPVTGRTIHEPGRDSFATDYKLDWREVLDAARLVLSGLKP